MAAKPRAKRRTGFTPNESPALGDKNPEESQTRPPASTQMTAWVAALFFWTLTQSPELWVFVLCYVLSLSITPWILKMQLSSRALLLLTLLPLAWLGQNTAAWISADGPASILAPWRDRLQNERVPTLAPRVVFLDHPQQFFIYAPGAQQVRLRLGPGGSTLPTDRLGHALFRANYDPRLHGRASQGDGEVTAWIETDGDWTPRAVTHVAPGPHPRWFCGSPAGTVAGAVSEETDELLLTSDDGRVASIHVGDGPTDCVFLDEHHIAISHRYGATLWVVDIRTARVQRRISVPEIAHGAGVRLALTPSSYELAIAHRGGIVLLDSTTFQTLTTIGMPETESTGPDWILFSDNNTLVASTRQPAALLRFTRATHWAPSDPLPLGRPAVTMGRAAGGVWIATTDYHAGDEPHYGNHFVQDQLLRIDVPGWRVHSQFLTGRRSVRQSAAGNIDRGVSPMSIETSNAYMRVVFAGTDEVWTWPLAENGEMTSPPSIRDLPDLPAPHGVFTFASGAMAVSSPSSGAIGTLRTEAGEWRVVEIGSDMPARRRGERGFYESTRSGISCQACHLHGDSDFAVRNIGGRRLAPTLGVGGLAGTSPFLRDGTYPRIRDLEHTANTLFRGYLRAAPHRGEDLEAYVHGLPRRPVFRHAELARERRGLDLFVRSGCEDCHRFPSFTNLGQLPLGTLFPDTVSPNLHQANAPDGRDADETLDTPSLLSVSTHRPYLSDGRAETLRDVLTDQNSAGLHGDTLTLSPMELDDLVYFLEGL